MRRTNTTLLVANPTARSGKAETTIQKAMSGLDQQGLNPEFFSTLPDGATVQALSERLERDDISRVAYLGGDGTFAEAAKGIILAREDHGVDVPLAMLPMGTANDQGRSFGIMAGERALEGNIEIIAKGYEQWLDVGKVEVLNADGETIGQDLWFDNFGIGLSARILAQRNRDRAWVDRFPLLNRFYRDKVLYVGAGITSFARSLWQRSRFSLELIVDGEAHEFTDCMDLVFNGTILFGGDWIFKEDAKADDGKFEIVIFNSHADWVSATIRAHKHNPVTDDDRDAMGLVNPIKVLQGSTMTVRIFRPRELSAMSSQIDGEEFISSDYFRVENLFHHLRIIVPEDRRWI